MAYKGTFTDIQHPEKYVGDPTKIVYRSLWERNAFRWCDQNPNVVEWASEEISIPYFNPVYNRRAKYYPDLFIKTKEGKRFIIEIKPKKETVPPIERQRKTQKYMTECATYAINQAKWQAVTEVADRNNTTFQIWTEDTLKAMGIYTSTTSKEKIKAESKTKKPKKVYHVKRPTRKS